MATQLWTSTNSSSWHPAVFGPPLLQRYHGDVLLKLFVSYLGQFTNVVVGILMLPLILIFLNSEEFLLWSLFTAIGGLLLQVEAAIQSILVRNIASNAHSSQSNLLKSLNYSKKIYLIFSLLSIVFLIFLGVPYLYIAQNNMDLRIWPISWLIFSTAYFFNFFFGPNNCLLIATQNTTIFNVNNMTSRLTNLALVAALLALGCGVYALVLGFAASVALGCALNSRAAVASKSNALKAITVGLGPDSFVSPRLKQIAQFSLFLGLSYWLYRLMLLATAVSSDDQEASASLALALQLFAIFTTLALTPIQMRVAPLISALKRRAIDEAAIEFCRIQILVNVVMVLSTVFLVLVTPLIRHFASIEIVWPTISVIFSLSFAFLIEANLQVIANLFVAERDYRFIPFYCLSAVITICLGILLIFSNVSIPIIIFVMASTQMLIALPIFVNLLKKSMRLNMTAYRIVFEQSASTIHSLWSGKRPL